MFFKPRRKPEVSQIAASSALARIADEVRALRPPTSSLYYACVQERLHAQETELAAITAAMDRARAEGFAAAVRLMSLDAPERVVFNAFSEIADGKGGAV